MFRNVGVCLKFSLNLSIRGGWTKYSLFSPCSPYSPYDPYSLYSPYSHKPTHKLQTEKRCQYLSSLF